MKRERERERERERGRGREELPFHEYPILRLPVAETYLCIYTTQILHVPLCCRQFCLILSSFSFLLPPPQRMCGFADVRLSADDGTKGVGHQRPSLSKSFRVLRLCSHRRRIQKLVSSFVFLHLLLFLLQESRREPCLLLSNPSNSQLPPHMCNRKGHIPTLCRQAGRADVSAWIQIVPPKPPCDE